MTLQPTTCLRDPSTGEVHTAQEWVRIKSTAAKKELGLANVWTFVKMGELKVDS